MHARGAADDRGAAAHAAAQLSPARDLIHPMLGAPTQFTEFAHAVIPGAVSAKLAVPAGHVELHASAAVAPPSARAPKVVALHIVQLGGAPQYPALHTQADTLVEPGGLVELAGHATQVCGVAPLF